MWDGTWNGGRHSQTSQTLSRGYSDIWRSGDNPRPLSNSPAATVVGPPSEPLTGGRRHPLWARSATIFFRRPFSCSSWRKRLTSDGSKLPKCFRQL